MKKILCFLAVVCFTLVGGVLCLNKTDVRAEEDVVYINDASEFIQYLDVEDPSSKNYVLINDIILQTWQPVSLSNVSFDGNGFSITTPAPLFSIVDNGSLIKNLSVKASINFKFSTSVQTSQNFGLLACDVKGSTIDKVFVSALGAPENVTPEELLENTYGLVSVTASASTKVGGLCGTLQEGSVVRNCYSQMKVEVTQSDENALSTVVGGLFGEVSNAVVANCYASAQDEKLINASFSSSVLTGGGELIVGGFAGCVNQNVNIISNVFVGGSIATQNIPESKSLYVGKLFGKVLTNTESKIQNVYSYNQSTLPLIASGATNFLIKVMPVETFKLLNNFSLDTQIAGELLWNQIYDWGLETTWCKKDVNVLPVLQVFELFNISLRTEQNSLGLTTSLLDKNQTPIVESGNPVASVNVKFGQTVYIKIEIQEDFLPYKAVKSLRSTTSGSACASYDLEDVCKTALVPIIVSNATATAYYAETYDLSYDLKVISANNNQGQVRVKGATAPIPDNKIFSLSYLSTQSFVAVAANSSYIFEKWVWVGATDEDNVDAFVGDPENEILASYGISLKFGDKNFSKNDLTYVVMNEVDKANIPFVVENGKITFTLKAQFVHHNEKLSIVVSSSDNAAEVYVNNIYIEGQAGLDGISFEVDVTVGVAVEIEIVVHEGFVFNGWSVQNQSFNSLINTQSGETNLSTLIHLTPSGELTLFADVGQQEVQSANLTWLWIALGGLGGVGLITLIVVIAVKRKKRESFVRYY